MTHIKQTHFIDEYDLFRELKDILARDRYIKPMKFLLSHFNDNHRTNISVSELREKLLICEYQTAYQILESLSVLGLLIKAQKAHSRGKKNIYLPRNPDYWDYCRKILEKDGTAGTDTQV